MGDSKTSSNKQQGAIFALVMHATTGIERRDSNLPGSRPLPYSWKALDQVLTGLSDITISPLDIVHSQLPDLGYTFGIVMCLCIGFCSVFAKSVFQSLSIIPCHHFCGLKRGARWLRWLPLLVQSRLETFAQAVNLPLSCHEDKDASRRELLVDLADLHKRCAMDMFIPWEALAQA